MPGHFEHEGSADPRTVDGAARENAVSKARSEGTNISGLAASTVLYQPNLVFLDALLSALDQGNQRIFVFVNGPVSPAIDARLAELTNGYIIRAPVNVGLGTAMNAIAARAHAEGFDSLLLFDQDSAPDPSLAGALADGLQKAADRGLRPAAIGPLLVAPAGEGYLSIRYSWRDKAQGLVDFVPTSGSLLSLAAWHEIGPFRDDYFVGGLDVEWGFRAWHRGYSCLVDEAITMNHRWGHVVDEPGKWQPQILRQSPGRSYFYVRNSIDCLGLAHIPLRWKARFLPAFVAQIGLLLAARRLSAPTRLVVTRGVSDGLAGRMGPLPADLPLQP